MMGISPPPVQLVYVVSGYTHPPREGQHIGHFELLRYLAVNGFDVSFVALVRDSSKFDPEVLREALGGAVEVTVIYTRLNYPLLLMQSLLLPGFVSRIKRAMQVELDRRPRAVFHLEGIGLMPLVPSLRPASVVVTTTDAWSLRQRRLSKLSPLVLRRMAYASYARVSEWVERTYFPQASAVQVISDVDAQYIRLLVPHAQVHAIPIGLQFPTEADLIAGRAVARNRPLLLFWGDIAQPHLRAGLVWLLSKVKPLIADAADWVVLGRRQPDEVLRKLDQSVSYIEWAENIDTYLMSASAVLLPDASGTGLKNRAVHAMACGVPVVGTQFAFEGFAVVDGVHAMVRDDPVSFAAAIHELLCSAELSGRLRSQGREFALTRYSMAATGGRWSNLYRSLS